jgi:phospholipid/cholesterol/gamma-HCH transport system ATP-binding protein
MHSGRWCFCDEGQRGSGAEGRVIEFLGVHKAFGAKRVLEGLSLTVPVGQTTALIGFSGTGKSVALKHVVGLLTADRGTVLVEGRDVAALSHAELDAMRGRIGYVFQFAALFDSLSVADNIRLALRRRGIDSDEMEARVRYSLEVVDLGGTEDRYPAELSGGMRKRVGIARAIAIRPRYLLYDEPTTGLDPVTSAVIDRLMIKTRKELGVTALMVTHDMRSAYTVADRIALLYQGRIRQEGTVEEIRQTTDPVVRQFIEGRPDGVDQDSALARGAA